MALLFMDGFEYPSGSLVDKYDYNSGGACVAFARTGTNSYEAQGGVRGKLVPASGSTVIIGFGLYLGGISAQFYIQTGEWNTTQIVLAVTPAGGLTATRGVSVVASAPDGTVKSGTWSFIEWKVLLDQSAGTVTAKVNGKTVITETGKDTAAQAGTTWDRYWMGFGGNFDDVYICDGSGAQNNDFIGECRVITLLPQTDAVAAGSNADFTCSTSTDHGAMVDETSPDDDTSYVYSSTLSHVDSWEYPALGYTGSIKGVQMSLYARKTDSGTRAIAAVTRPASTNRVHATDHYLGTDYTYWLALWELNPEDSAAWEVADVDGAEFGVKVMV